MSEEPMTGIETSAEETAPDTGPDMDTRIRELEEAIERTPAPDGDATVSCNSSALIPDGAGAGMGQEQASVSNLPDPLTGSQDYEDISDTEEDVLQAGPMDGQGVQGTSDQAQVQARAQISDAVTPVQVPVPVPVPVDSIPLTPTIFRGEGDDYHAIRKYREDRYTMSTVNGASIKVADNGSFYSEGTGRLTKTNLYQDLSRMQNITATFEPTRMCCTSCEDGHVIRGKMVVLLGDQGVPAAWPCEEAGKCITIIRIEDGGLLELGDLCIKLLKNRLEEGSIVLLSAGSQLSAVGISAYTSELAETRIRMQAALKRGVLITHGPIYTNSHTKSATWAGAICNLMSWLISRYETDCTSFYLNNTYRATMQNFTSVNGVQMGRGVALLPNSLRHMDMVPFAIGGHSVIREVQPLSEQDERRLTETMVEELNINGVSLSYRLNYSRASQVEEDVSSGPSMIIVGGANASRLSSVAINSGLTTKYIKLVSLNKEAVEEAVTAMRQLVDSIEDTDGVVVVAQTFDEFAFMSVKEDGSTAAPVSDSYDLPHIIGELLVIAEGQVRSHIDRITPILKAAGPLRKVVLGPLPRYVKQQCCDRDSHVSNRGEKGFEDAVMRGIAGIKNMGRRHLHNNGLYGAVIINIASVVLDEMTAEAHERSGEASIIHATELGYRRILLEVEKAAGNLDRREERRSARTPHNSGGSSESGTGGGGDRRRSADSLPDDHRDIDTRRDRHGSGGPARSDNRRGSPYDRPRTGESYRHAEQRNQDMQPQRISHVDRHQTHTDPYYANRRLPEH